MRLDKSTSVRAKQRLGEVAFAGYLSRTSAECVELDLPVDAESVLKYSSVPCV